MEEDGETKNTMNIWQWTFITLGILLILYGFFYLYNGSFFSDLEVLSGVEKFGSSKYHISSAFDIIN